MDFFAIFMGWVVRLSVNIGWALGAGVQQLILSIFSPAPGPKALTKAQKREQDETRRIAGCREVVLHFINNLGFIARECMSREELEEKIDSGITREELYHSILKFFQVDIIGM